MKLAVVFFALASVASASVSLKFFGIPSESNSIEWASNDVVKPTICFNEQKHAKDDVKRWKLAIVGPWMRARKLKDVVFKPVDVTATNDREVQNFVNSVNINVDGKPLCYSAAFTVPADLPKRKAFQLKFKRSVPFLPFLYHSRNKSDKFPILKEHTSSYYQTAWTDAVDDSAALSAADDYEPEVAGQVATGLGNDDSGMRDFDSTQERTDRFEDSTGDVGETAAPAELVQDEFDYPANEVLDENAKSSEDFDFKRIRDDLDAKYPTLYENAATRSKNAARNQLKREQKKRAAERKAAKEAALKEHTSSYYQTASTDAADDSAALSAADDYESEAAGQDATGLGDYDSGMRDIDNERTDRFMRSSHAIESRMEDYERPGARDYAKFVSDRSQAAVNSPYYKPTSESSFDRARTELNAKYPEVLKNEIFASESEDPDVDADVFDPEDTTGDIAESATSAELLDLPGDIGEPAAPAEFVEGEFDYPAGDHLKENVGSADELDIGMIPISDAKNPALVMSEAARAKKTAENRKKNERKKRAAQRKAAEEKAYAEMADLD